MMEIELVNIKTKEVKNLVTKDIKMLSNVTSFSHEQSYNTLEVDDYAYTQTNRKFKIKKLSFKALPLDGKDIIPFKKFIRRLDSEFILRVKKNGVTKYCYVRWANDDLSQLFSTEIEDYTFVFNQVTNWIKTKIVLIDIDKYPKSATGYANSTDYDAITEEQYHYPIIYSKAFGDLDQFNFELPESDSDSVSYIDITITDFEPEPGFGLNGKWDNEDVRFAYKKTDKVTLNDSDVIVVDSFPKHPRIVAHPKLMPNETINIEQDRVFEKNPYIYYYPWEENTLVFFNVRKARLTIYEQYFNL